MTLPPTARNCTLVQTRQSRRAELRSSWRKRMSTQTSPPRFVSKINPLSLICRNESSKNSTSPVDAARRIGATVITLRRYRRVGVYRPRELTCLNGPTSSVYRGAQIKITVMKCIIYAGADSGEEVMAASIISSKAGGLNDQHIASRNRLELTEARRQIRPTRVHIGRSLARQVRHIDGWSSRERHGWGIGDVDARSV